MLLNNFLLSTAKRELSPHLVHVPRGAINKTVQKVIKNIDIILFDCEGKTTKEYFVQTPRRYQALEVVLSYLVQEGFSQMRQDQISKKSGISVPIINFILNWLEDLQVCHQIKTRRHGKKAPSIYILSLNTNYLKIIEYFKQKWAFSIDMFSTFTKFLSKKLSKKQEQSTEQAEKPTVPTCQGIDILDSVAPSNEEVEEKQPINAPDLGKKLELRFREMDEFMSKDQKKLYMYIISKDTNITEKDAYTIALRMPPDVDWEARKTFEDCVQFFEINKSQESTPAHFITIYTKQLTANRKRRQQQAKENIRNIGLRKSNKSKIPFDLFKKMLDPNA
ncbi:MULTISPECIES: Replicase RepFR55 [unclassified Bacillus cereus group]|uniref:Replicase RepFR55 n=1 Tax=unclassified Bacillus cereus group TaxID=2750818 RepID=UPI0022E92A0B|nr:MULTISPECIES: Replicase RepFR55 [unclassified Bacillus cereus group]MDA2665484.1 Replicase RepFR55 [Bacillus cereus group sp. Bc032]MDA2676271.1 Replicase RepFR55 [Bacillus cereus group sp. Bc031]MDA2681754.1 Replicase RepFR55 [Bacillus cereus group sp. Bc029]MDA2687185.1 Replicase RepFR55 [Bacillus cereus group sp. Bc030]MDA2742673.1 Replicase RepFR55 [Bacillus cereus group sp. Bc011]